MTNKGSAPLSWSVSATQPWLSLSATGGTLSASGSVGVVAALNAGAYALSTGSYSDTITFTDFATGFTQARPVSLLVANGAQVISVTPVTSSTFSGYIGGPFTSSAGVYLVSNTGNLPLTWQLSGSAGLFSGAASSGTLAGGASATVTVSAAASDDSLPAGTYNDTLSFTNLTGGSGNTTRAVALTVLPPVPNITSATSMTGTEGNLLNYQIVATNNPTSYTSSALPAGIEGQAFAYQIAAGNSPTSFGASGLPTGLGVDPVVGLISGTLTVSGTFNATIGATNAGGTGSAALTIVLAPVQPPTFAQWSSQHFTAQQLTQPNISGPAATPQNDGVPNLLKYLYDIDPTRQMTAADIAAMPQLGATTYNGASNLTLTFIRTRTGLQSMCKVQRICKRGRLLPHLHANRGNGSSHPGSDSSNRRRRNEPEAVYSTLGHDALNHAGGGCGARAGVHRMVWISKVPRAA